MRIPKLTNFASLPEPGKIRVQNQRSATSGVLSFWLKSIAYNWIDIRIHHFIGTFGLAEQQSHEQLKANSDI